MPNFPFELFRDQPNRIEGRCQGNKLTVSVNGQEITSVEDTRLTSGGLVGMGGVSHSKVPMSIFLLESERPSSSIVL
jgi:hypothetical protein